jgi:hypothetical protein
VKRVVRRRGADYLDEAAQSPYDIAATLEMKTVWHPMGA